MEHHTEAMLDTDDVMGLFAKWNREIRALQTFIEGHEQKFKNYVQEG